MSDKRLKILQEKIAIAQIEYEKQSAIVEKENVKNDMLKLLNTLKRYNATYYYNRATEELSEVEKFRALNRRVKFPEVEKKNIEFMRCNRAKKEKDSSY